MEKKKYKTIGQYEKAVMKERKNYPSLKHVKAFRLTYLWSAFLTEQTPIEFLNSMTELQ